jgi:hypothetical protein
MLAKLLPGWDTPTVRWVRYNKFVKKFTIPYYSQADGSNDCGPTCAQMILDYYGIKHTIEHLRTQLTYDETGTSIYDNGLLLLNNDLQTEAITAQPLLFSPDTLEKYNTNEKLLTYLTNKEKEAKDGTWILRTMRHYLEKNGTIKVEIPTIEHIKTAINNDRPVMALMHAGSLGSNEGQFHFVVLTGYDDQRVFINNPWPYAQRQEWFPIDRFMYGLYASTCEAFDNGTLLIASK